MGSFGTDLWNNLDSIDSLTADGISSLNKLVSFLSDLQEAEKEYSKNLEKIAKKYIVDVDKLIVKEEKKAKKEGAISEHPKIDLSTVNQAWKCFSSELDSIAKSHLSLSETIHDDLIRLVKIQEKEMGTQRKKHLDAIKTSKAGYKVVLDKFNAVEKSWKSALKDKENAQKSYEKAIQDTKVEQKDVDKLKLDNENKAKLLEAATEAYLRCTEETNAFKENHFNVELRDLLNDVQKNDEISRTTFIKQSLSSLLDMYSKTLPAFETSLEKLYASTKVIDGPTDSQLFIRNNAKAGELPKPFDCTAEKLVTGAVQSPTVQSPIFATAEDEIMAITDSKKARKKAFDRLASLEKELKKHELQRSLSLAAGKDVREYDRRINVVKVKIHKLSNFILRLDGQPEKELPAELSQFEASLTAHDFDILETLVRATGASPTVSPVKSSSGSVRGSVAGSTNLATSSSKRFDGSNGALVGTGLAAARSASVGLGSRASVNNSPANNLSSTANLSRTSAQPNATTMSKSNVAASEPELVAIGHCVALYDFDAEPGTTEISVKANQSLEILEKQDEWWNVRIPGTTQVGFVPANYCQ